ncbi:hypothetical protein BGZ51_002003 [Haplosporangium sp. Z 767]|nr:hypothetical protein BGZ51_002003 [Haplosporangium sp. Z 767]
MTMDRVDNSGQEFESGSGAVHSLQTKRYSNEGMENADPELADRLLAALLVLYKDAMINLWTPSYPPPFFHELQTYTAMASSLKLRSISKGNSIQEQEAAKVAMQASDVISGMTFAECLFFAIVSLQRPSFSFKQSLDLAKNSYEDLMFRSLIQRIAKRIGLRKSTSAFEQLKFRLYQYLDLVVTDPVRYCKQNTITEVSLWVASQFGS